MGHDPIQTIAALADAKFALDNVRAEGEWEIWDCIVTIQQTEGYPGYAVIVQGQLFLV